MNQNFKTPTIMTLFKNKYRIESFRLKNWDYQNAGAYFITICTKDRAHYFGEILDGEMQLNKMGKLPIISGQKFPNILHMFN